MRKTLILGILAIVVLLAPRTSLAQMVVCQLGPGANSYNPNWNVAPTQFAAAELTTIYRLLCPKNCGRVDLFQNATTPNALTMTVGSGISVISYNPVFMNQIYYAIGPEASFGIMAHEFGHHVDFHTTPAWMNSSWGAELKADAWSGCALARKGMSSAQISVALGAIAAYPSPSHPAWNLRIPAVQQGFLACGGKIRQLPWGH